MARKRARSVHAYSLRAEGQACGPDVVEAALAEHARRRMLPRKHPEHLSANDPLPPPFPQCRRVEVPR